MDISHSRNYLDGVHNQAFTDNSGLESCVPGSEHFFAAGNAFVNSSYNWQSPFNDHNSEASTSPAQTESSSLNTSNKSYVNLVSDCSPSPDAINDAIIEPSGAYAWLGSEDFVLESPEDACGTNQEFFTDTKTITDISDRHESNLSLRPQNMACEEYDEKLPHKLYSKKRRVSLSRMTTDTAPTIVSSDRGTPGYRTPLYQDMQFSEFQAHQWHTLCDINGRDTPTLGFRVIADKGFIYSPIDKAHVNQKKNHFQVSAQIENKCAIAPKFVKVSSQNGTLRPIKEFELNLYGVKTEMLTSIIQVKQFQSDRKANDFEPIRLDITPNRISKVTVGRLHFSETTINNQRKSGAANPNQRYFYLVAALNAVVMPDERYTIMAYCSEAIIVRASNPGQFGENGNDAPWQKGKTPESVVTQGPVGIGTEKPTSMLSVAGDIQYTGTIYHPSDARLKENIKEVDSDKVLSNMGQMRFVNYNFIPEVAGVLGVKDQNKSRMGVLAQEILEVLPDAVKQDGEFLTVDDNRIFYESAAAVKELCRLTGDLESKIDEVEKIGQKLCKFSRDSLRRSVNSLRAKVEAAAKNKDASLNQTIGCLPKTSGKHDDQLSRNNSGQSFKVLCLRVPVRCTIAVLILIMLCSLAAICTIYVLDRVYQRPGDKGQMSSSGGWNYNKSGHHNIMWKKHPKQKAKFWKLKNEQDGLLGPYQDVIINQSLLLSTYATGSERRNSSHHNGHHTSKHKFFGLPLLYPCQKQQCSSYCCRNALISYEITDQKSSAGGTDEEQQLVIVTNFNHKAKSAENLNKGLVSNGSAWQGVMKKRDKKQQHLPDSPQKKVMKDLVSDIVDQALLEKISKSNRPKRNASADDKKFSSNSSRVTIEVALPDGLPPVSLDSRYIANEQMENNLSYYIPISEFMPFTPVTVKFRYTGEEVVQYCDAQMGDVCTVLAQLSEIANSTFSVHEEKANEWSLPVGLYQLSSYKFRFGKGDKLCSAKSSQESSDYSFEYNLVFYRICQK